MLPPAQSDRLDVILVSPRNPLNIGAVARAMANFGFASLKIVAPWLENWPQIHAQAQTSAVGAEDIVRDAQIFPTLAEAIAPSVLVVGTGTLTSRQPEQQALTLPQAAVRIQAALAHAAQHPTHRVALVFGSEKHGLSRQDLSWCHLIVEIPTDSRQPSMNLAQAAAVCLYALASGTDTRPLRLPPGSSPPEAAVLDRLADAIQQVMAQARYSPRGMSQANAHDLRLMLRRLHLSIPDVRRILRLFQRIHWQLRHRAEEPSPPPPSRENKPGK